LTFSATSSGTFLAPLRYSRIVWLVFPSSSASFPGFKPVRDNFFAAIFNNPDAFDAPVGISVDEFRKYLVQSTAAGVVKEDVMNHFWEIDNKPVEDKLYWEEVKIDMRKHK